MDNNSLELQIVQKDLKEAKVENVVLKKKSNKYCKDKKEAEERVRDSEIIISNLQQRVEFLNKQMKNLVSIEEELKLCKDKLKLMENVQKIVNATHQEVEEMLEQYGDRSDTAKSLSTQCVILSRELNSKAASKQKADEDLRKCRRQLSSMRVEFQEAKKQLVEKEEYATLAEEDVKRYVTENGKLQDKLRALQDSIASPSGDVRNSALSRLLNESPAPAHLRMSNLGTASPSTPTSLFLPSKKPRLETLNVSNLRPTLSNPQENIEEKKAPRLDPFEREPNFKRKKVDSTSAASGYYYDGFGGHSKPDIYPKGSSKSLLKTKAVTIRTKGKTQTTTLDYFFME